MGWEKELEELRRREALAEQMGGEEKVARQHGRGKMDARARLAALCDDGTFREIGKIAGKGSYDEDGNLESSKAKQQQVYAENFMSLQNRMNSLGNRIWNHFEIALKSLLQSLRNRFRRCEFCSFSNSTARTLEF